MQNVNGGVGVAVEEKESVLANMKSKNLSDVTSVQVSLGFADGTGFVVPLTEFQGAYLVRMLGIRLENGVVSHFTDKELNEIIEKSVKG